MAEISIVIPCRNEAPTIEACVRRAADYLTLEGSEHEIVVVDNDSCDSSAAVAHRAGARVVHHAVPGYGEAVRAGLAAARGRLIVIGDADGSYHFDEISEILGALRDGSDLVIGNRFLGGIDDGAMPVLHRYFGNPLLSLTGRLLFGVRLGDFHCGLRGLTKEASGRLSLRASGMELASEMIAKAAMKNMRIAEVPVHLYRDLRTGPSHLRTWSDGMRHLRCMLMLHANRLADVDAA